LPRTVTLDRGRLRLRPIAAAERLAARRGHWAAGVDWSQTIGGSEAAFWIRIDAAGFVMAERKARDARLNWRLPEGPPLSAPTDIVTFVDAGLIELFLIESGRSVTAYVPGAEI